MELGILPLGAFGVALNSLLLFTVPTDCSSRRRRDHRRLHLGQRAAVPAGHQRRAVQRAAGSLSARPQPARVPRPHSRGVQFSDVQRRLPGVLPVRRAANAGHRRKLAACRRRCCRRKQIFLVAGLFTIPVFLYIVFLIPQASIRFLAWLLSLTIYRLHVYGRENLPRARRRTARPESRHLDRRHPADAHQHRPVRMIAWAPNIETRPWIKRLADLFGAIPDRSRSSPKKIVAALRTAREAVQNGDLVCIFPEGGLTRSGQVQAFKPGLMKILEGTDAPVVPIYLEGLWGSIFSFKGEKFFWKWPERLPYPVSIHFGRPIQAADDVFAIRQAVLELGSEATEQSMQQSMLVTQLVHPPVQAPHAEAKNRRFERHRADRRRHAAAHADPSPPLPPRPVARRTICRPPAAAVGRRLSGQHGPGPRPPHLGQSELHRLVRRDERLHRQAGIKHVITSRKFMDKMDFKLNAEIIYLEDFKDKPTAADKAIGFLQSHFLPAGMLGSSLGLKRVKPDDVLTVIFTSGSTGTPKGVMLTYANVASNVAAIDQVVHLRDSDVLIGILPFFHSFGYTVTLWGVASLDIAGAYHYNPLDARQIGKLIAKSQRHDPALDAHVPARPTSAAASPRRFKTLDVVVCGAEKLPKELADEFEKKFGVRPVEGYGTTELSPLVSVNIPPSRSIDNFQADRKEGSVGRTVPGVTAKVTDLDTGEELSAGKPGMLWITGPNVMKGYLNQPEKTAEVIKDGWYKRATWPSSTKKASFTSPAARAASQKSAARWCRTSASKKSWKRLAGPAADGKPQIAVTAVPDAKKGERLIVLHTKLDKSPDELRKGLTEAGLPNLFIPSADSFL